MSDSISVRNIPTDLLRVAQTLSMQTGLSINDIFRLALASGLLIEATKITPGPGGTLGGLEPEILARALRRHLGAAIDLLMEHKQHPYQDGMGRVPEVPVARENPAVPQNVSGKEVVMHRSIDDDLEMLGIGRGLSESLADHA